MTDKNLIVIVGPTAVGKTELAIQIAQHFGAEIISADSRQFYTEMHIGTAKPSDDELAAVNHHFINSNSIHTLFSTGDFEMAALSKLTELYSEKNILVMAGGSGLYINAVCKGLDSIPEIDMTIRTRLNQLSTEEVRSQLAESDPEYFSRVDQNNRQRMIRGLEVYLSTGQKFSAFLSNSIKIRDFNMIKIGLNMEREKLYTRINSRVERMMEQGLLEEVRGLIPYRDNNALKTVGYTELFNYLDGTISLTDAINKIKQNTRRFAKRQLTWFNKDPEIKWFEPHETEQIVQYIKANLK